MSSLTPPAVSRRIMPVLFIGVFMAALDTAVIGPAIPALRQSFAVGNREAGLVMSIYILFSVCSTPLMANLSDRHGRRTVYLSSVACFAAGSLAVAISGSFWSLLLGRAIQGIGAGGITPAATAVIGDVFPPEERGRALGLIGATFGMAFVLGPPLAAGIMVAATWHAIFLINLPIAAVVIALGARILPTQRAGAAAPPLDLPGAVGTFVLLGAVVLGITRIVDAWVGVRLWPWFLGAAALTLPVLVRLERRAARPMLPLALLANRQLAITYGLALAAGFGMGSVVFLSSLATLAYGVATEHAGFVLLPMVVFSIVGSVAGGRLLNRLGARRLLAVGFALLAGGYALTMITSVGLNLFLVASIPTGLGVGIVVGGSLRAIALEESPQALRAAAQGLINVATSIGTLLSAAVISVVADLEGGGASGFAIAYAGVAALMLLMLPVTWALRAAPTAGGTVEPA